MAQKAPTSKPHLHRPHLQNANLPNLIRQKSSPPREKRLKSQPAVRAPNAIAKRIWTDHASFRETVRHAPVRAPRVLRIPHMGFRVAARCRCGLARVVAHLDCPPASDLLQSDKYVVARAWSSATHTLRLILNASMHQAWRRFFICDKKQRTHQRYLMLTISNSRIPDGACTCTTSPSYLPIKARATGLETEIKLARISASTSPTI